MTDAIGTEQEQQAARARMGRVARHSAFFFSGTLFVLVLSYGFRIYLARTLGPTPLGLMALGESILAVLGIVALLGLDQAAFRFVPVFASKKEWSALGRFMWSALWQVLGISVVLGIALALGRFLIAERIFSVPELAVVLPWFGLILILRAVGSMLRSYVRGFQEIVRFTTITSYVLVPLKMGVTFLMVSAGLGVLALVFGEIVMAGAALIFLGWLWWQLMPPATRKMIQPQRIQGTILQYAVTLIGLDLVSNLGAQAGQFTLAFYLDAGKIGIYSTAVSMVALLATLQGAIIGVFRPQIAELRATDQHALLAQMYHRVTRWGLVSSFPLAVALIFLAPLVMQIFGQDFVAGAPVLALVTLGMLFNIAMGPAGTMLLMTGHERTLGAATVGQFAAAVGLNVLLVPRIGLVGAGVANMMGTVVYYTVLGWLVHRRLGMLPFDTSYKTLVIPFAVTTMAGVAAYVWASALPLIPILQLLVSGGLIALVFLGLLLVFGFDAEERHLLREGVALVRTRVRGSVER